MAWELVAIWAICAAAVIGFVRSERAVRHAEPVARVIRQPARRAPSDTAELRRRRLRAIGF
jgi:hypothetical protein